MPNTRWRPALRPLSPSLSPFAQSLHSTASAYDFTTFFISKLQIAIQMAFHLLYDYYFRRNWTVRKRCLSKTERDREELSIEELCLSQSTYIVLSITNSDLMAMLCNYWIKFAEKTRRTLSLDSQTSDLFLLIVVFFRGHSFWRESYDEWLGRREIV